MDVTIYPIFWLIFPLCLHGTLRVPAISLTQCFCFAPITKINLSRNYFTIAEISQHNLPSQSLWCSGSLAWPACKLWDSLPTFYWRGECEHNHNNPVNDQWLSSDQSRVELAFRLKSINVKYVAYLEVLSKTATEGGCFSIFLPIMNYQYDIIIQSVIS